VYGKIFESIYDSSLAEDYLTRLVFMDMIVLADKDGLVDMTLWALCRRTNIPQEIIEDAIVKLESPDPNSRSTTKDGRRIERLNEGRSWGWRIVNYHHYRQKGSTEEKRHQARIRKQRQRLRGQLQKEGKSPEEIEAAIVLFDQSVKEMSRLGHAPSRMSRHTDTDADTDEGEPPPSKICEICRQEFMPRLNWHTKCDNCFQKPSEGRVQPKGHHVDPCTQCGWPAYSGYEGMVDGVCLDCRQPEEYARPHKA